MSIYRIIFQVMKQLNMFKVMKQYFSFYFYITYG